MHHVMLVLSAMHQTPSPAGRRTLNARRGADHAAQVHGDVFRAPAAASLLSVYAGTGAQLLACAGVTMVFAVLGFLSPANRGGLMTAMLLLFVFMGLFAGYASARLYKTFKARARPSSRADHACLLDACEACRR